jgi:glycosyltransferase involved in cell wall biosynthesis
MISTQAQAKNVPAKSVPHPRVPGYLFVLPWYPESAIGGVNQALLHLIDLMNSDGRRQPFLLIPYGPDNPSPSAHLHCPAFSVTVRAPIVEDHPFRGPLAFLFTLPWTLVKLRRILRERDIQTINCVFPEMESLMFVMLKRLGLFPGQVGTTLQGNDIKVALDASGWGRRLLRWMFRRSDFVVACSRGIQEDLLRLEPACKHNSVVIHNSIDIDAFVSSVPANFELPEPMRHGTFLLNIGRYEHKKGQDLLIRAFEQIADRFPRLFLVMIGAPGTETSKIRELVARSPVSERISMIENVPHEQVPAYLRAALVFVLPSRREGLPFAILEAAACRKPVVAAAAVGVPELIEDQVTGRLVPVEDDRALAEAISDLVAHSDLRERVAENLHRLVSREFTWRQAYDHYMRLSG